MACVNFPNRYFNGSAHNFSTAFLNTSNGFSQHFQRFFQHFQREPNGYPTLFQRFKPFNGKALVYVFLWEVTFIQRKAFLFCFFLMCHLVGIWAKGSAEMLSKESAYLSWSIALIKTITKKSEELGKVNNFQCVLGILKHTKDWQYTKEWWAFIHCTGHCVG